MKRFADFKPIPLAVVGIVVGVAAVGVTFNINRIFGTADTYHADLGAATSLVKGDVVRVSGVDVGTVSGLSLERDHVKPTFTVKHGVHLPAQTRLDVGVLSPLGNEYVALHPDGSGRLSPGATIPVERTTVPLTLVDAFSQAGSVAGQVDVAQVRQALEAVKAATAVAPATAKQALKAVTQLSQTVADHQAQLHQLLGYGQQVTGVLDQRRTQIVDVVEQGDQILQVLAARKTAISTLLTSITTLDDQLSELLSRDKSEITPLLANLRAIAAVLAKNDQALSKAIPALAAFDRYAANANGSGPFTDLLAPTLLIPDNVIAECAQPGKTTASAGCTP